MAGLSEGHQTLRTGIDQINSKADATAAELSAAAQRQNTMQQSLASVNEALASHATTVAENQRTLNAGIGDLSTRTQQLSGDLASVATTQNSFRQMQQSHNEAIDIRTAELADNQRSLRNQMDTLTATAGQTALSVLTLNNGQATFQQAMQTGMNGLSERAGQIAEQQTALHQSVKSGNESLAARTAAIAEDQQTLKTDVARTAKVIDRAYADLTAVAIAQETLQTTFAGRSDEISSRVARIEGNQKVLGGEPGRPDGNDGPDRSGPPRTGRQPRRSASKRQGRQRGSHRSDNCPRPRPADARRPARCPDRRPRVRRPSTSSLWATISPGWRRPSRTA